jgi:hypothetical protein
VRLEDHIDDICKSMAALIAALEKNINPFLKKPKFHEKLENYEELRE